MLQSMKDLFPLTREVSYLDTGAEGLPPLYQRDRVDGLLA